MNSIRSLFLGLLSIAVIAGTVLLTASFVALMAGLAAVTLIARALIPANRRAPIYARARKSDEIRVWNDGRGTIIDQ
ncbi:hypothetical protein NOF55_20695 [Rhizobiaceae bacterium BDR2-2]|uniref:Uncharacterized protein n=1 Tax=Ectorhizobium quercum TaxID=2965071 RepID=A0AAE3N201_9HYPH|nr:hypothetical protein [Ectorhizobium quercum]MCX8999528.1 hypothetical protein [Ectorhizobium quercum]